MTASVVAIAIAIDEDDEVSHYRWETIARRPDKPAVGSVEDLAGLHHVALDLYIG